MKNALKYGLIIGIISGIWILILHVLGVYEQEFPESDQTHPLEYVSILIPIIGLYLGIRNFRNNFNGGRLEFMEGVFEGLKIMVVGGIIAAFFGVVYFEYVANSKHMDFMGRIAGAGLIGILTTLASSLLLMNKQHNL